MTETRTDPAAATGHDIARAAGAEPPRPPADPEALRAEIELTRAQLADTVAALAAKTDLKSRVRGSVSAASGQVRTRMHDATGRARQTIGGVGDQVSAAMHSPRSGGHRADRAAPPAPVGRRAPTVATGAVCGALVALVVYLVRRGRR